MSEQLHTARTQAASRKNTAVSADERERMIAEAAYFRAQQRGFTGDPLEDWLSAEAEVDRRLRNGADAPSAPAPARALRTRTSR